MRYFFEYILLPSLSGVLPQLPIFPLLDFKPDLLLIRLILLALFPEALVAPQPCIARRQNFSHFIANVVEIDSYLLEAKHALAAGI